jgi:hypothetical protein
MYTPQRRGYSLRHLRKAFLTVVAVLMTACDPGISIQQITSQGRAPVGEIAVEGKVVLEVKTTHQLIGEAWYDPEIRITNSTSSPITIENVELVTTSKTYTNTPARTETSPLRIQPGSTETLHVLFRLDGAVYKVFRQPGELQVHYQRGVSHEIARASVGRDSR